MPIANSNIASSGGSGGVGTGWADFDDNEWKDLDDDQMEPFEPFESPVHSSKATSSTTTASKAAASKPATNNNDWTSDWSSSFDTSAVIEPIKSNSATSVKQDSKLPGTSSYNWSSSAAASSAATKNTGFVDDRTKNEEDLFSSLVKDVSLTNKVLIYLSKYFIDSIHIARCKCLYSHYSSRQIVQIRTIG